jgi:hypothetical protein
VTIIKEFVIKASCEGLPGQSVLGLVLVKTPSKVPAHASRFVRNSLRLKIFFTVAGIEECSNCDVSYGPEGPCNTAIFSSTACVTLLLIKLMPTKYN